MLFFLGFFKFAIYAAFLPLQCDGIEHPLSILSSTFTHEITTLPRVSQRFACVQYLPDDVSFFRLNVTLNSSAILRNPDEAVLVQSSPNNTWHYLENISDFYPEGLLVVEFTLYYDNETPRGDCLFSFDETTATELMTIETYTKNTTPTPFNKSTTSDVSTTPKLSTVSVNNTIVNTTTPELINSSMCLCPCACTNPVSKQNSEKKMAAMLEDLKIPKLMTSFSKRKLISAPDHRLSCKGIGVVGTFVMAIVFGVIVIGDVKLFLINARTAYGNLRGR